MLSKPYLAVFDSSTMPAADSLVPYRLPLLQRKVGVFAVKSQILHEYAQSRTVCLKAGYLESVPGDHWKLSRTA